MTMDSVHKIAVLAGSYPQFHNWLRESGTSPKNAVFALSAERLMGTEFNEIVYVGAWREHPDANRIEAIAKSMVR